MSVESKLNKILNSVISAGNFKPSGSIYVVRVKRIIPDNLRIILSAIGLCMTKGFAKSSSVKMSEFNYKAPASMNFEVVLMELQR